MASVMEVKVPDIGDFADVPVIEILVKPGDTVTKEASLVTLESDKATMDVPSPADGVVKAIAVKVGDKVAEGSLILTLETAAEAAKPAAPTPAAAPTKPAPAAASAAAPAAPAGGAAPAAATYSGKADLECEMLVLGSGPGGYSAAFRSADLEDFAVGFSLSEGIVDTLAEIRDIETTECRDGITVDVTIGNGPFARLKDRLRTLYAQ